MWRFFVFHWVVNDLFVSNIILLIAIAFSRSPITFLVSDKLYSTIPNLTIQSQTSSHNFLYRVHSKNICSIESSLWGLKETCCHECLMIDPSNAKATFGQSTRMQWFLKNFLKLVVSVFIRELSLSTLRWVPTFQGFNNFSGFLHHFVLTKLATSSARATNKIVVFHCSVTVVKYMYLQ